MARKKDFVGVVPASVIALPVNGPAPVVGVPTRTVVQFPPSPGRRRSYDFARHYGVKIDAITRACQQSITAMLQAGKPEPCTVTVYCGLGLRSFLSYCADEAQRQKRPLGVEDIDRNFIDGFIAWLGIRQIRSGELWSYAVQRNAYKSAKAVLWDLFRRGLLRVPIDELFPANPYPNSNSGLYKRVLHTPLSDAERRRVLKSLGSDVAAVCQGRFDGPMSEQLSICLLAIALRTGRNTTPLLELRRDAIAPHPIKASRRLLVTHKRRGNSTHLTPLRFHETREHETDVGMDVMALFERAKALTAPLVAEAPPQYQDRLWLYRSEAPADSGRVKALSRDLLQLAISAFTTRHQLARDDGTPLRITISLLRKTMENRLWRLSGGDLFTVARLVGHSPTVADRYYLQASPEMLKEHRLAGEVMVESLSEHARADLTPTPVARCKDPLEGEHAPHTGKACMDFLSCFRCKSFVVTSDDLYRLFSFYWLMYKERHRVGARQWAKVYRWVIRVIDRDIAPQYPEETIRVNRDRARRDPHPFWRTEDALIRLAGVA